MQRAVSVCLRICCRFQSYLDHLAMQENEDNAESEEMEWKKIQCKEKTVSSPILIPPTHQSLLHLSHPSTVYHCCAAPLIHPLSLQKGLWRMFARNVISFRRGLQSAAILKQFQKFLIDEINRGRPCCIGHVNHLSPCVQCTLCTVRTWLILSTHISPSLRSCSSSLVKHQRSKEGGWEQGGEHAQTAQRPLLLD